MINDQLENMDKTINDFQYSLEFTEKEIKQEIVTIKENQKKNTGKAGAEWRCCSGECRRWSKTPIERAGMVDGGAASQGSS